MGTTRASNLLNGGTPATDTALAAALAAANAMVDAAVARRYDTSAVTVGNNPELTQHAVAMTTYFLVANLRKEVLSEVETDAWDKAERYLRRVEHGDELLNETQPTSVRVDVSDSTTTVLTQKEGWTDF